VKLHCRRPAVQVEGPAVVCVHGIGQHGGIFEGLAQRLGRLGYSVTAVDLRGHGSSGRQPPWDLETHIADLEETVAAAGIECPTWVAHSFGGKVVAALASRKPELAQRLVLLDPGLEVPPDHALRRAEIDRLDWSFATVDGATAALVGAGVPASARDAIARFVKEDAKPGPDQRLRLSASPGATVVAWSEMCRPLPPLAQLETLVVRTEDESLNSAEIERRLEAELGPLLRIARVPHGHNVLWEAPEETAAAVGSFLGPASA